MPYLGSREPLAAAGLDVLYCRSRELTLNHMATVVTESRKKSDRRESKQLTIRLRIMIIPYEDRYLAECIDLNICVLRNSPEEAQQELLNAIHGYLATVFDDREAKAEFAKTGMVSGLIPRHSPRIRRLLYTVLSIRGAFSALSGSLDHARAVATTVQQTCR